MAWPIAHHLKDGTVHRSPSLRRYGPSLTKIKDSASRRSQFQRPCGPSLTISKTVRPIASSWLRDTNINEWRRPVNGTVCVSAQAAAAKA
eukprot:12617-Chlamydomonas_euryale.AAC.2